VVPADILQKISLSSRCLSNLAHAEETVTPSLAAHFGAGERNLEPVQTITLIQARIWIRQGRLTGVVQDAVVEGDRISGRITWRGTHVGPLLGLSATGKPVRFGAMHPLRFEDVLATAW
jgi:hypothetical protein